MRRYSSRNETQTLSELNVTPLLDLAFVLLIIFMITTPLMENSTDLVLPGDKSAQPPTDPKAVQTLSIDRNEAIALNGTPMLADRLESELTALKQSQPEIAVVVRSHRELPVQKLVDVLAIVRRAGIQKVGVVTQQEQN